MPPGSTGQASGLSARRHPDAGARRRTLPERDAVRLLASVGDPEQILAQLLVDQGRLRREERDECVVRSLCNGGACGHPARRARQVGVALVSAHDRVDRVEYRDVDDCHGACGAARPQLLGEVVAIFDFGHRLRVVEPAGVDRDLVPVSDREQRAARIGARDVDQAGAVAAREVCVGRRGRREHHQRQRRSQAARAPRGLHGGFLSEEVASRPCARCGFSGRGQPGVGGGPHTSTRVTFTHDPLRTMRRRF